MKKRSHSTGMSGVYYVAAELSPPIRNYTALVTTRNTRAVDIVAMNNDTLKSVGIQVKTNAPTSPHGFWLVGSSDKIKADNLVYIFVNLNKDKQPSYFVVPAKEVKDRITTGDWASISRRSIEGYSNRWDIIDSMTK